MLNLHGVFQKGFIVETNKQTTEVPCCLMINYGLIFEHSIQCVRVAKGLGEFDYVRLPNPIEMESD